MLREDSLDHSRPPQHGGYRAPEVLHWMRQLAGLPDWALRARYRLPLLANQRHHLAPSSTSYNRENQQGVSGLATQDGQFAGPRQASDGGRELWRSDGHMAWNSTCCKTRANDSASSLLMRQGGSLRSMCSDDKRLGESELNAARASALDCRWYGASLLGRVSRAGASDAGVNFV